MLGRARGEVEEALLKVAVALGGRDVEPWPPTSTVTELKLVETLPFASVVVEEVKLIVDVIEGYEKDVVLWSV